MKMKPLVIGDLVAKIPIVQGGMGVGVSRYKLAGTVAKRRWYRNRIYSANRL